MGDPGVTQQADEMLRSVSEGQLRVDPWSCGS